MKLTKKSRDLMLFFSKNKQINFDKKTDKTNKIITEIHNNLLLSYSYVNQNLLLKPTVKKINSTSQIIRPKTFSENSFPEIIRKHINDSMMSEISYSFSLNNRKVKVVFVLENHDYEIKIDLYNRYVEIIAMWLFILNMYASKKCAENIVIYFYFTSLEKQLPTSNLHILNQINVNTAFTTTCPKDSEIVVFRKEEWFKVFIHETFHNFGLDFSMMNNGVLHNCILNIFKVKSDVNAFEAYTEFWAEIINANFCSFFSIANKNDNEEYLSTVELYINFEKIHSIFQLVKTLDFMGLQYSDLYLNTKRSASLRENLYKENTNVLSYYIIKSVLLNNYQGFLSWCRTNNLSLLDFKKTGETQNQFCKFIEKNYKTSLLLDNINQAELFLSKIKNKKSNYKYILNNLRMSICELG